MKKVLILLASISLFVMTLNAASMMPSQRVPELTVNNIVLAKINGKAISVYDLMKKMDFIFYREFPQYAHSTEARYQFFKVNWSHMLDEMIDAELILANAKEVKITVSEGDVRQEIEAIFGPNVVVNIDKLDLTYQEVFKMVQNDITTKRMTYSMAQVHAFNRVGPKEIKAAYEAYNKEHPIERAWDYRVISIKAPNQLKGSAVAELTYKLLSQDNTPLDSLATTLNKSHLLTQDTTVSVSEEMHSTFKELSDTYKSALTELAPNTYSKPAFQVSRSNKQALYRIFYITKYTPSGVVPLAQVEEQLKNVLLDQAIQEETALYRKKLRKRFGIDDTYLKSMIPEGFEPFTLN
ncbi:MAG: SurA N-terminal domain-containing protein [Chlamydiales bacterium]|nr:SurA N-terminal domain-containing protein [Chlamydiales bacterium]